MPNHFISRLRPEIATLHAYSVADAAGMVKLDAMENPFSWPVEMRSRWLDYISRAKLNRYPEPDPELLKQKLIKHFGPSSGCGLILGNGSDELIQLLALAIAKPGASMLSVSPSFSMYEMIAQMIGLKCHVVPLGEDYQLNMPVMLKTIEQHDPALIFIAYPNNPTGNLWPRQDVEKIIKLSQGLVVIDEAYGPFASDSFSDDLANHENMLLLRTASKMGLAGVRFGWLAGESNLISQLNKIRLPYNINQLTQLSVTFALDNYSLFAEQAETIRKMRGSLFAQISAIEGVKPFVSEANFILFKILNGSATDVFENLLQQKVLIKNLSQQAGLENCLRVTVGSKEENKIFCDALVTALNK